MRCPLDEPKAVIYTRALLVGYVKFCMVEAIPEASVIGLNRQRCEHKL